MTKLDGTLPGRVRLFLVVVQLSWKIAITPPGQSPDSEMARLLQEVVRRLIAPDVRKES